MKLSLKVLFVVMAMVGVLLTLHINNALALDSCDNPMYGDLSPGGNCIGVLELHELGSFDESGVWQWNLMPEFQQAIDNMEVQGDMDSSTGSRFFELANVQKNGIDIPWSVLRNRRGPVSGDYAALANGPDASVMFEGTVDTVNIPRVVKYDWGFMIDHDWNQNAINDCEAQGWMFEPGDGSPCDVWHGDADGDALPDYFIGYLTINVDGELLSKDNIAGITWVEQNVTVPVRDSAHEHYIFMKYDMGQNVLENRGENQGNTVYSESFGSNIGPAVEGTDNTFIITLNDGRTASFTKFAASNRLMPTVPSTITSTQLTAIRTLGKSGKVMAVEGEVTIANMTAREIADEEGNTRLLIQWAEPDLAMTLSENDKDVRLRIWVGNHWLYPAPSNQARFLWMDLPVTSGSVVVPAPEYAWLKDQLTAIGETQMQISGQYREQFDGFHNRGYMGVVLHPIQ